MYPLRLYWTKHKPIRNCLRLHTYFLKISQPLLNSLVWLCRQLWNLLTEEISKKRILDANTDLMPNTKQQKSDESNIASSDSLDESKNFACAQYQQANFWIIC